MTSVSIRQCAVLTGGLGTRLGAVAGGLPKALQPCGGQPFLFWLLRELSRFGVERVLLLTGHLAEAVEAALPGIRAALPKPLDIHLSREPAPAGTGGALWHARGALDERFLLVNGDSLLDANLAHLLADAAADGPEVLARLALRQVADASRYGVVERDGARVTAFRERPPAAAPGVINAGVYVLRRALIEAIAPPCSLERDVLPGLAAQGAVRGSVLDGWFIDIGIPADLARAQAELPARLRRRALFLDRDGVVNVDHGYVGSRARFEWTPTARAAIRMASDAGWHVFVVTNQSGVARGRYSEADVIALHRWAIDEVRRAGGTIDDLRYCPHHTEAALDAYRRDCDCRKPQPGMLRSLIAAWGLDPAACVLIGDQMTDLAAARAAGVPAHQFFGGDLAALVGLVLRG